MEKEKSEWNSLCNRGAAGVTDGENPTLEGEHQSSVRRNDVILLIALSAFVVFLAVAVFIILIDTRGLWMRPPGGIVPMYLNMT